jgi:hypothetical protein
MTKLNTKSADEFFRQVDALEAKLAKIKKMCQNTLATMNKDSGKNPYAIGRCIEAMNVLYIIEGENE